MKLVGCLYVVRRGGLLGNDILEQLEDWMLVGEAQLGEPPVVHRYALPSLYVFTFRIRLLFLALLMCFLEKAIVLDAGLNQALDPLKNHVLDVLGRVVHLGESPERESRLLRPEALELVEDKVDRLFEQLIVRESQLD